VNWLKGRGLHPKVPTQKKQPGCGMVWAQFCGRFVQQRAGGFCVSSIFMTDFATWPGWWIENSPMVEW
jgi:hypothetical protein